jgi:hypothetical protein
LGLGEDDYGYFGKGTEGYVQYMEAFEDRGKRGGRKPPKRGGSGCLTVFAAVFVFFYILYQLTE